MKNKEKEIEEMSRDLCHSRTCDIKKNGGNCYKYCNAYIYAFRAVNAGYRKMPDNIGEFSDGYHTFNELYHHRAVLFSVICNMMPEKAWKSKLHDTGDMYDGMFIVGIETEQGQATYHYDIAPYWDMFKVKELEKAPKYDGHTPSEAIQRIGNITAGYRKASDVARETVKAIKDEVSKKEIWVSEFDGCSYGGFVIATTDLEDIIRKYMFDTYEEAELKKKYESEGEG